MRQGSKHENVACQLVCLVAEPRQVPPPSDVDQTNVPMRIQQPRERLEQVEDALVGLNPPHERKDRIQPGYESRDFRGRRRVIRIGGEAAEVDLELERAAVGEADHGELLRKKGAMAHHCIATPGCKPVDECA